MFETALASLRPSRKGFVLVSTGLHATLAGALILPPMLRMPDLGAEPPDRMPKWVQIRVPEEEPRRLPPTTPRPPVTRASVPGHASNVRVVTVPRSIPDVLPSTSSVSTDDVEEVIGSVAQEPEGPVGFGPPAGSEEGPISADRVDVTRPVPLSTPAPSYPDPLRIARIEGVVILESVIGTDGLVRDVRVLRSVNPLMDRAATQAVLKWRYTPALIGDRKVAVYLTVTVSFHITR